MIWLGFRAIAMPLDSRVPLVLSLWNVERCLEADSSIWVASALVACVPQDPSTNVDYAS